jgi:glutaredoxin
MRDKALIYTKDECVWCERAKGLLILKGFDFDRKHVGKDTLIDGVDLVVEDFKAEIFDKTSIRVDTLPQIFLPTGDGMIYIGGFDDLQAHFDKTDVSTDDFSEFSL